MTNPLTLNARLIVVLITTLVLTILPMPTIVANYRPPYVLLFVLYVQFFLPCYFRVTWILLLGLSLDVLLASVMGEHAFALLLTSWLASGKTRRFNFFSTIQQMVLVFVFCLLYQGILYVINASFGYYIGIETALGAAFIGVLFWPWIRFLADHPKVSY